MNIRRGFNRLYVALYAVWLIVLLVGGLIAAYGERDYYSRKLQEHEKTTPDQRRADLLAFSISLPEKMPNWTEEERQRFVTAVERVLNGQSRPEEDAWFEGVVRPSFSLDPALLLDKYLTPTEVKEHRKWRDHPVLTFAGNAFSSRNGWAGWILVFAIPGGLYLSISGLAYGSRWVYRGFASTKAPEPQRNRMGTAETPSLSEATSAAPVENVTKEASTTTKRVFWLVVVTALWILVVAGLSTNFRWARGTYSGAAWWLWIGLAVLWRLVMEFFPKKQ